jgi:hypothetical protein
VSPTEQELLAIMGSPDGLSLNEPARVLHDPTAARPVLEGALAIRERFLGPDHPDTVATRRALAELAAEGGGPGAGC